MDKVRRVSLDLYACGLNLPVIYLTDRETERSRREARLEGAVGYFRKPIDEQAPTDAITFAVQRGRPHRNDNIEMPDGVCMTTRESARAGLRSGLSEHCQERMTRSVENE